MKFLIAEDDKDSRQLLQATFESQKHTVVSTENGVDALLAALADPPDVIISDVLMPRLDGFDLCRILKKDKLFSKVPFIFYTATFMDFRDEQLAKSLGADLYLIKPMEVAELLSEVNSVLERASTKREATASNESNMDDNALSRMHVDSLTRKLSKKVRDLESVNAALRSSEEMFHQLVENIRECFWIAKVNNHELIYASPTFNQIWGVKQEKVISEPEAWRERIHPEDRNRIQRSFFERACLGGVEEKYRVVHPDVGTRWVRDRAFPVADKDGQIFRIAGIAEDITEAEELSRELAYHATHDTLTGLANRRVFERRLKRVLTEIHADKGEHAALCYLDLDRFKVINDACGHVAGDDLLRQIGAVMLRQVREHDILARLGGDEFAVLMEHCPIEQAKQVAKALQATIEAFRFRWQGRGFRIGVSIGIVAITRASKGITDLVSAADTACYAAKDKGGNRIHVYREDDADLIRRRGEMQWATGIQQALEENQFRLYFQPIIPLRSRFDNIRCELLLRIVRGEREILQPGIFMPAAERYNLATKIDCWVIQTAFEWFSRHREHLQSLSLCEINLSGHSLGDPDFLKFLVREFENTGIPPERICFEVTETAVVANLTSATYFMQELRILGCKFALDDFGRGLSSFAYLKTLPVDYLKIDGLFVKDITSDPIDFAMVKSISEIGRAMGKQTIAEFVESKEVLEKIRLPEIGVDFAQGYHIGRPKPLEEMPIFETEDQAVY